MNKISGQGKAQKKYSPKLKNYPASSAVCKKSCLSVFPQVDKTQNSKS